MLVLTRKLKQQIVIGNDIVITLVKVKGQTVRIGIEAPAHFRIMRKELHDAAAEFDPPSAAEAACAEDDDDEYSHDSTERARDDRADTKEDSVHPLYWVRRQRRSLRTVAAR